VTLRMNGPRVAMAVRKGQPGRLAYLSEFVEEAKSGLVKGALEHASVRGVHRCGDPLTTPARQGENLCFDILQSGSSRQATEYNSSR
jgi:hypothetical protein